jgi:uncharacterized 2Fe-2S/4Fe-4S cluster protein (DUF4445 family)
MVKLNPGKHSSVVFHPSGKTVDGRLGSLLEIAHSVAVEIDAPCGGRETCGKCRVIVREGYDCLSPVRDAERRFLTDVEVAAGYRLSCCVSVEGEGRVVLEVPPESQVGMQRLLAGGLEPDVSLSPVVSKFHVELPKPQKDDLRSDTERLVEIASKGLSLRLESATLDALKALPLMLREGGWKITITVRSGEVIAVEPGETRGWLYGFAVDIGTTKLAGYLVDLNTGRNVATLSTLNPQMKHGGDVLTRITYAMKAPRNLEELHQLLIDAINDMISEICKKLAVREHEIYDVVAVGNTAMHHLFFNIDPKSVGLSPYPAVIGRALDVRAKDLGLRVNAGAYVHSPPNVAGFVGADAVADVLAVQMQKAEELTLLIDIGTNVEIVLGDRTGFQACSTPAGPALEGSEISFGMRAVDGAIESVWIDPTDMTVGYSAIGAGAPKGICGSGIIDAIAEMLKARIITPSGEIRKDLEVSRIRSRNGLAELLLVESEETAIGKDIVITQQDIRQIQLAKAAVYTGVLMSIRRLGVKPSDVKRIYVAGAFGTYLNPQSARNIGLYHDIPLDRIKFVGNAAGAGARALLKSNALREVACEIASKIKYFPVGDEPDFQNEFLNALYIPHKDLGLFPSVKWLLGSK